jgi:hypothetical protein
MKVLYYILFYSVFFFSFQYTFFSIFFPEHQYVKHLHDRDFVSALTVACEEIERLFSRGGADCDAVTVGGTDDPSGQKPALQLSETPVVKPLRVKSQKSTSIWRGIEDSDHVSGPELTEKTLKDAVVLVCVWNSDDPESAKLFPRIEQIWKSFNHKHFKVVASDRGANRVCAKAESKKYSFSFYEGFGCVKEGIVSSYPSLYVVTSSGNVAKCGENDRIATQTVVNAFAEQYERMNNR